MTENEGRARHVQLFFSLAWNRRLYRIIIIGVKTKVIFNTMDFSWQLRDYTFDRTNKIQVSNLFQTWFDQDTEYRHRLLDAVRRSEWVNDAANKGDMYVLACNDVQTDMKPIACTAHCTGCFSVFYCHYWAVVCTLICACIHTFTFTYNNTNGIDSSLFYRF